MKTHSDPQQLPITFDNSYARLPSVFYHKSRPVPVKQPELIKFNNELSGQMDLDLNHLDDNELVAYFSGNSLLPGSEPLAMAYAGHQFGSFVSQLGDGRAVLLGEIVNLKGKRYNVQLKGSGLTNFSRGGDGRSALGPVIREYIVSEAMHALGIPTTRALAMVTTGENVLRQTGSIPGGILTRVASGFERVGTFEYFTARKDHKGLKQLGDYVITNHYPEAYNSSNPYLTLFEMICEKQAKLIPQWMQIGFIHGVMNTDNTSICGETIDFGPCAFMDNYDPNTVFSSIDMHGRYCFVNQGSIIAWNLSSLGNSLVPLLADKEDEARELSREVIKNLQQKFLSNWQEGMNKKLGLEMMEEDDLELLKVFLEIMKEQKADYTLSFRYLADNVNPDKLSSRFAALFSSPAQLTPWIQNWRKRLEREKNHPEKISILMNKTNPAFIPRNHRVEKAIQDAETSNDFIETYKLIEILKNPYIEQPEFAAYMEPPKPEERVLQTFCGT